MTYGNSYIVKLIKINNKISYGLRTNLKCKGRTLRNHNQQRPRLQTKIGIMMNLLSIETKMISRTNHCFKSHLAAFSTLKTRIRNKNGIFTLGCGAQKKIKPFVS